MFVPILVIIIGSYLVVAPIVTNPVVEYLYVLVALVLGVVVYIPFVYYKVTLSCLGKLTFRDLLT